MQNHKEKILKRVFISIESHFARSTQMDPIADDNQDSCGQKAFFTPRPVEEWDRKWQLGTER
jgi:hypothetical protein